MDKQRIKNIIRGVFFAILFISISIAIFGVYATLSKDRVYNYTLILNGTEIDSVDMCSENWSYENLTFIPCVDLKSKQGGGIMAPFLWWNISPEENCERYGFVFPGFNLYNETRNQEIYKSILPICNTLKKEDVILPWLTGNCNCTESKKPERCKQFICSENFKINQTRLI
jgi:hypothetical protein